MHWQSRFAGDPRELPAYSSGEVAHYLSISPSTVRYWTAGRTPYAGLIEPASRQPLALSFFNLSELHVLAAIRRKHRLSLPKVRIAIEFLERRFSSKHPLISHEFQTDGVDLFVDRYGQLINLNQSGQLAMRGVLDAALRRIERDPTGFPIKLFPFTRSEFSNAPEMVVIDPVLSGGRPVISGTGIATEIIAERYKAGESIEDLALDYGRPEAEIEEAIRCELQAAA